MRFELHLFYDPQALPRVLDYFAQRALVLSSLTAELDKETMYVVLKIPGLDEASALVILEKMRSSFLVKQANLSRCGNEHSAGDEL